MRRQIRGSQEEANEIVWDSPEPRNVPLECIEISPDNETVQEIRQVRQVECQGWQHRHLVVKRAENVKKLLRGLRNSNIDFITDDGVA